ncbi:MAG: hexitol phosphatase HxpB [Blastocatellia bacterium]|nr:hexitol phosphatase HxpB [Blastocatellia bacterium]
MTKAIIFDMDGLLIDSEPLWHEAEMFAFPQAGIELTRENCLETTGLRVDAVVDYWYQRRPWKSPSKKHIEEAIINKVVELVLAKGEKKEGVDYVTDYVASLPVKIALASSSPYRIIRSVVEKFQLSSYFHQICSAEEEEYGKPHPGVYITTAKRLDVKTENCLAVEDSITGVIAAKAASMQCIAVPEEAWKNDKRFAIADLVLNSLLDFNEEVWNKIG